MSTITSLQIGQNKIEIGIPTIVNKKFTGNDFFQVPNNTTTYEFDLSSYLPNDDFCYKVYTRVACQTDKPVCSLMLWTSEYPREMNRVTGIVAGLQNMNDMLFIVGKNRKIYYKGHSLQWQQNANVYIGLLPISYQKVISIKEGF